MTAPSNHYRQIKRYDAFVRTMRVLLALLAGVLGFLIVFWPVLNTDEMSFTLSYDDVLPTNDVIRLVAPKYTGTDGLGRLFSVQASEGIQEDPEKAQITLRDIDAHIELDNDLSAKAHSEAGVFALADNQLSMSGEVTFTTSDGYLFRAREAMFDISNKDITSNAAIDGQGPLGQFSSDGFYVDVKRQLAIFSGNVHLRINPLGETPTNPQK